MTIRSGWETNLSLCQHRLMSWLAKHVMSHSQNNWSDLFCGANELWNVFVRKCVCIMLVCPSGRLKEEEKAGGENVSFKVSDSKWCRKKNFANPSSRWERVKLCVPPGCSLGFTLQKVICFFSREIVPVKLEVKQATIKDQAASQSPGSSILSPTNRNHFLPLVCKGSEKAQESTKKNYRKWMWPQRMLKRLA